MCMFHGTVPACLVPSSSASMRQQSNRHDGRYEIYGIADKKIMTSKSDSLNKQFAEDEGGVVGARNNRKGAGSAEGATTLQALHNITTSHAIIDCIKALCAIIYFFI